VEREGPNCSYCTRTSLAGPLLDARAILDEVWYVYENVDNDDNVVIAVVAAAVG